MWEVKILSTTTPSAFDAQLKDLYADGWRVVHFSTHSTGSLTKYSAILERENVLPLTVE